MAKQPQLRELAVISDRNTCALIDKEATISWYCPIRFDSGAVFSSLIDAGQGGFWSVTAKGARFFNRTYTDSSSALTTTYAIAEDNFSIKDWMPLNNRFSGICRQFSPAPVPLENRVLFKPDFGLRSTTIRLTEDKLGAHFPLHDCWLRTSHPLQNNGGELCFTIPAGEAGWAVLTSAKDVIAFLGPDLLEQVLAETASAWQTICNIFHYKGSYQAQVHHSLRAIHQLTFQESGGIIAAATTSLPEVISSNRNYDYRYVWMRDAAMITSALVGVHRQGRMEENFLSFMCGALTKNNESRLAPFYAVDKTLVKGLEQLPLQGYRQSQPVQIGNGANEQLQLDANANVLLSAKRVYEKFKTKEHWESLVRITDHLVQDWQKKDSGIWEEEVTKHYTTGKVLSALGLEFMAKQAETPEQQKLWNETAAAIRKYVSDNCMTSSGAFAVYAGSDDVDVSAALFPIWGYTEAGSTAMVETVRLLKKNYCRKNLFWRRLEEFDSSKEGAFLAGTFWMAQYYVLANKLEKAKAIIDAALAFSNDLGYFSEEADVETGEMLGNFPQTFVHSSLISAVVAYQEATKATA